MTTKRSEDHGLLNGDGVLSKKYGDGVGGERPAGPRRIGFSGALDVLDGCDLVRFRGGDPWPRASSHWLEDESRGSWRSSSQKESVQSQTRPLVVFPRSGDHLGQPSFAFK